MKLKKKMKKKQHNITFFSYLKDVVKLIHKNRDEQSPILDLSKNNVTIIPTSLKEVNFVLKNKIKFRIYFYNFFFYS